MNRVYTLGDLATLSTKKQAEPRLPMGNMFAFSFEVKPHDNKHAVYLAAIDGMNAADYEPREHGCVKAILRYPSIIVRGALKVSLEYYKCVRDGLQAAMGEDVQVRLVWRGDTALTDGAVIEVKEIE